jgi:hypothetical protein
MIYTINVIIEPELPAGRSVGRRWAPRWAGLPTHAFLPAFARSRVHRHEAVTVAEKAHASALRER